MLQYPFASYICHACHTRLTTPGDCALCFSSELLQQDLRLLQGSSVKALGEPAVDFDEQLTGVVALPRYHDAPLLLLNSSFLLFGQPSPNDLIIHAAQFLID